MFNVPTIGAYSSMGVEMIDFHEMAERHFTDSQGTPGSSVKAILYKGDSEGMPEDADPETYYIVSLNVSNVDEPIHHLTLMYNHFKIGKDQAHGTQLTKEEFVRKLEASFRYWKDRFKVGKNVSSLHISKEEVVRRIETAWNTGYDGDMRGSYIVEFELGPGEGFTPFRQVTDQDTLGAAWKARRGTDQKRLDIWIE